MSVLMRGVNMPKNCEECNFKGECRDYWEKIREVYTRPSWCPLVEVFDKDINVRSKEPKPCEWCKFYDGENCFSHDKCKGCIYEKGDSLMACVSCQGKVPYDGYDFDDEPQTETEIAKAIVHKMIDDAVIAEDAYPDLRQRMHEAVERLDEYYSSEDERSEND